MLGVDPGYGNTGVVLRLHSEADAKAAVCYRNDQPTDEWDILRSEAICIPMIEQIVAWINTYDIEELEVCLEVPFYAKNAQVLLKQMTLFVLIQKYVWDYLVPIVDEVYLTIVSNKTSKAKLAHGGADKLEMVKASPWAGNNDITFNQAHTLADAYAHSLSSGGHGALALHKLSQYMVEANHYEEE